MELIMRYSVLTAVLLLAATNAFGQAADPCATQASTSEIDACAKLTLAQKDRELNVAYQKRLKRLVPAFKGDNTNYAEVKKHLIEAQRNWVKFRDSDCQGMLTLYEYGSIRGAVYFGCLTGHTERRTRELLAWGKITDDPDE